VEAHKRGQLLLKAPRTTTPNTQHRQMANRTRLYAVDLGLGECPPQEPFVLLFGVVDAAAAADLAAVARVAAVAADTFTGVTFFFAGAAAWGLSTVTLGDRSVGSMSTHAFWSFAWAISRDFAAITSSWPKMSFSPDRGKKGTGTTAPRSLVAVPALASLAVEDTAGLVVFFVVVLAGTGCFAAAGDDDDAVTDDFACPPH